MENMWTVQKIIEEIDRDNLMLYVGCGVELDKRIENGLV